jgi:dipeptidyl aminopeptidase/acylaminoacyl peptidase
MPLMKQSKLLCMAAIAACSVLNAHGQRAMTVNDLAAWQRITSQAVSSDGRWTIAVTSPSKGDATLSLYDEKGEETARMTPVKKGEFSVSGYLLVTETTPQRVSDSLKLKKTKADKTPMDRLLIYTPSSRSAVTVDSLRSYKLAEEADVMAYMRGRKDTTLFVCFLDGMRRDSLPSVSDYTLSKDGRLYYVSRDTTDAAHPQGLYTYGEGGKRLLMAGKGEFKQLAPADKGNKIAFLYCADKDAAKNGFELYISEGLEPARIIASKNSGGAFLPEGWIISDNKAPEFTKENRRLMFGISPAVREKDTTVLAEDKANVQVWNWNEEVQYTVQNYNRAQDLKKTYSIAYNLDSKSFVTLTTPDIARYTAVRNDAVDIALQYVTAPYQLESMWTGAMKSDVYTVNMNTGERRGILTATIARVQLSPAGKYAYWYNQQDSSWYTYSIANGKEYRLTTPATFGAWDEDNDVPDYPSAHGSAGWSKDDASIILYDRYDIWQFDPQGVKPAICLTQDGRQQKITYRRLRLDPEEQSIDMRATQLLRGFNNTTKGYGYYSARFSTPTAPRTLLAGDYMLSAPVKAKKADAVIFTQQTYEQYPDIRRSDLNFRNIVQLTHCGDQQEKFIWGTAELTSWTSADGQLLEGVIYKPANFDPTKKYPLIVNFYERNSETLHSYHNPEVGRSTIDYHFYNSNGYVIFNPDIVYEADGHPGESCFNSVVPGTLAMIAKGYIDEKAIGAQGHSWGGYQDAYLATRTNLFAAIESGAPVVNMFSAYGGIRWGSGLNRSFQYEHGQSRIGGSIWEAPLKYLESSPLFYMNKVNTPILIMANDQDGHVPWYQGIEFFVALKRLGKPTWLLNYTGEPHWPLKLPNRMDFQTRMFQFFEHYLKGKPMPEWMSEGVKAVDREYERL